MLAVAVGQAAPEARAGGRSRVAPARVAAPPPRAVVSAARARLAVRAVVQSVMAHLGAVGSQAR